MVSRRLLPSREIWMAAVLVVGLVAGWLSTGALGVAPKQDCPLQSGPPEIGPFSYAGQSGNQFEYDAQAGTDSTLWYYQVAIKNTGKQPLTVDWPKPSYFRRGIPPDAVAPGQCLPDGNSPNQDVDRIMYGPNAQFSGPTARFYRPAPSSESRQTNLSIAYDSHLNGGRIVSVRVSLISTVKEPNGTITYGFSNKGSPVRVKWRSIEGPVFIDAAFKQLDPATFTKEKGILLMYDKALEVKVLKAGVKAKRVLQVLEISTPDGILVYRDLATAFTFDMIDSYRWKKP